MVKRGVHEDHLEQEQDHHAYVIGCAGEEESLGPPKAPVVSQQVNSELMAERIDATQHGRAGSSAHLDGISAHPVGEQTEAIDHEVHHHGVVAVLGAAQSGFNDGETGLHEHDEKSGDQCPYKIDRNAILARLVHQIHQSERLGGVSVNHIVRGSGLGAAGIACGLIVGRRSTDVERCVHGKRWRRRGSSGGAGRSGLTLGPCR